MNNNNEGNEDMDIDGGYEGGNISTSSTNTMSFVNYITTFTSKEKSQLLNMFQYGGISIIPLLILLKLLKMYMPEQDPFKPSTDILLEVIMQLLVILVALFLVHKMIMYFPTYSKVDYEQISMLSIVLPIFFIMFTLDTKISEKLNILLERGLKALGIVKEPMVSEKEQKPKTQTTTNTVAQSGSNTNLGDQMPSRLISGFPTQRDPPSFMNDAVPQGPSGMDGGMMMDDGPAAANEVLGGSSLF
tara:strand:- start:1331 stop:2065 length:735 start_codon:yes stop_codon:yes gene_type:complete